MQKVFFWITLLTATGLTPPLTFAANVSDFADFTLRDALGNVLLPGRLYIPPEAASDPSTPRPFILFLHGGGEEGTDNTSQINVNIDNLLAAAKQYGAYLYAPQSTSTWNSSTLTNNVMTMIARAEAQQNVDVTRLYVTGLSNGGGGTWNMLSRYPDKFAAALPIAGIAPASDFVAANLVNDAIWDFHSRDDTVVSVNTSHNVLNSILTAAHEPLPSYPASGSTTDFLIYNPNLEVHRLLEENINQLGNVAEFQIPNGSLDLLYYEVSVGGHGIWPVMYSAPPVYDWMFSHTLSVPEPNSLLLTMCAISMFAWKRNRVSANCAI